MWGSGTDAALGPETAGLDGSDGSDGTRTTLRAARPPTGSMSYSRMGGPA